MSANNSLLCSTHNYCWHLLCILDKAQPSTFSTWPWSPIRLDIWPRDLCLPNEYSLGHCGLSAANILGGLTEVWHHSWIQLSLKNLQLKVLSQRGNPWRLYRPNGSSVENNLGTCRTSYVWVEMGVTTHDFQACHLTMNWQLLSEYKVNED